MQDSIRENWQSILHRVRICEELSDISYKTWIQPLQVEHVEDGQVWIETPGSAMNAGYLQKKFEDAVRTAIWEITGTACKVTFVAKEGGKEDRAAASGKWEKKERGDSLEQENKNAQNTAANLKERMSGTGISGNYSFESFVTGSSNSFASAAARAAADNPGKYYNPLFIYSAAGLGKTHLLQAIGLEILKKHPHLKVIYVPAENFTNELIECIRGGRTDHRLIERFRSRYRGADVLLLDDIHFIAGKEATMEEFSHTFDLLLDKGKQIVISSDRPPRDMPLLDEHYRQRFSMGLQCDIGQPEYELRRAIVRKKCEERGMHISDEVQDYICTHITENVRDLEGALNKVWALGRLSRSPVTAADAAKALKDLVETGEGACAKKEDILQTVSAFYGIAEDEITGKSRKKDVLRARYAAIYLCRELLQLSLPEIGEYFGGRNHSTVFNALERAGEEIAASGEFAAEITKIKERLNKG